MDDDEWRLETPMLLGVGHFERSGVRNEGGTERVIDAVNRKRLNENRGWGSKKKVTLTHWTRPRPCEGLCGILRKNTHQGSWPRP